MFDFFVDNFSGCVWIAVILVAMIPTLESKIAIPFGMSTQIWGESALSNWFSCLMAFIGSMLPVIFVILLARFIKNKTSGFVYEKFVSKIEKRYEKNFNKLSQKTSTFKKCLMLATFVAIPLPLTGAYTGSLLAGFTNLKIWQGFLAVLCGEIVSCLVVLLLCTIFENSTFYILIISLALLVLYLFINLIVMIASRIKKEKR